MSRIIPAFVVCAPLLISLAFSQPIPPVIDVSGTWRLQTGDPVGTGQVTTTNCNLCPVAGAPIECVTETFSLASFANIFFRSITITQLGTTLNVDVGSPCGDGDWITCTAAGSVVGNTVVIDIHEVQDTGSATLYNVITFDYHLVATLDSSTGRLNGTLGPIARTQEFRSVCQRFDLSGTDSPVSVQGIKITASNAFPTANFSFNPEVPSARDEVTFDGSESADSDGTIVSYAWNFGDSSGGASGPAAIVPHTYDAAGEYDVSLTVRDNDGAIATIVHRVRVSLIQVGVDANGDGEISFIDDSDHTSATVPFRFWINDDDDLSEVPFRTTTKRDFADDVIGNIRDLEDFAQLEIRLAPAATNLLLDGYRLVLETTGGVEVNLFTAIGTGQDYVTNPQIGVIQTTQTAVNLANSLPLILTRDAESVAVFLFEGKTSGTGELRVVLRDAGDVEVSHGKVYVQLLHVADMYQRAQGTANGFSEGRGFSLPPPYTTAYRTSAHVLGYISEPGLVPPPNEVNALVVFVHGCCTGPSNYRNLSDTTFKRLWWQGYRGRFASFRWPAIPGVPLTFNEQEFRAWNYGLVFRDYLADLQADLPGYSSHVVAHSLGNAVVTEALKRGAAVETYILSQAAVPADCYDPRAPLDLLLAALVRLWQLPPAPNGSAAPENGYSGYCSDIAARSGARIVNFYNPIDGLLQGWRINNARRPDEGLLAGVYRFDPTRLITRFVPLGLFGGYVVTNPAESRSFAARSRTEAVGATGQTGGPITASVNLRTAFGLGNALTEHGAQFDRPLQRIHGYYRRLLEEFGLK